MKHNIHTLFQSYRKYRFEVRHLIVLFLVLILFQFIVLLMNQNSLEKVLVKTQQWYQQDAAERIANLTATSLELLLESKGQTKKMSDVERRQIIQDFNIIFSQQLLDKNVQTVCILIPRDTSVVAIDDGHRLFSYLFEGGGNFRSKNPAHAEAAQLYQQVKDNIARTEQTITLLEGQQVFHVFIPFVPRGEVVGAVYMKNTPNLSFLTQEMSSNYGETALVYSGLILIGLVAMFYISSRTLKERNEAQHLLFEEQKRHLAEQIHHQKEVLFAKRIYHTHHKAEKIGGFVKEDLRNLTPENLDVIKYRINKYTSFVARVIYDMKWYDPPIQTVRGPLFKTNVNEVIQFIVENIFKRVSGERGASSFNLELDPTMPDVAINEYVLWEVLEPIIQNSLDHAGVEQIIVTIRTHYAPSDRQSTIIVEDNGKGVPPGLLETDETGTRRVFLEHVSRNDGTGKEHSGYGCYIAYEIATQRCGWKLNVENRAEGGCRFMFTMPH